MTSILRMISIALWLIALAVQNRLLLEKRISLVWSVPVTVFLLAFMAYAFLVRKHPEVPDSDEEGESPSGTKPWSTVVIWTLMAGLAAYFLWRQTILYWLVPINPYFADMLPLIKNALRDFWRDGLYPYRFTPIGGWNLPLTYSPGHWLAFTPAHLFKFDLRFVSAATAAVLGLLEGAYAWRWRHYTKGAVWLFPLALIIAFFPWFFSPFKEFHEIWHMPPYWLVLAIWALAVKMRWRISSGVLFGIGLCMRPPLVVVAPFWLIYLWHNRKNSRPFATLFACFITGALIAGYFVLKDPKAFFYGVTRWYEESSNYTIANNPLILKIIGFSGLLREIGLYHVKMKIASALLLPLMVWAWFRLRTPDDLLVFASYAMTLFLMFSFIPWFYIYFPATHLLFFALWPEEKPDPDKQKYMKRILVYSFCIGIAITIVCMGWFLYRKPLYDKGTRVSGFGQEWNLWRSGWGEIVPDKGRRFVLSETSTTAPTYSTLWRDVELTVFLNEPRDWTLGLYLNGEYHGKQSLQGQEGVVNLNYEIHRGNLFRGLNEVHLSILDVETLKPPDPSSVDNVIYFQSLEFSKPLPDVFWGPDLEGLH